MSEPTIVSAPDDAVIPASPPTGNSDPKVYTDSDIEAARQQEKDKMYKRLEKMQEQVARLQQESQTRAEAEEAHQREIVEAQRQAEDADRIRRESEMSAKDLLSQREQEWNSRMAEMEAKMESERALRIREQEYTELMNYRQQVVQQYSDRVAPELLDLISGSTAEEIQRSAEDMSERTERILAQTQEAMQNARQAMPTVRATAPASGENSGSQRSFSPDEIRNMSMADYVKQRQALLGGGANGPKNRGLFG